MVAHAESALTGPFESGCPDSNRGPLRPEHGVGERVRIRPRQSPGSRRRAPCLESKTPYVCRRVTRMTAFRHAKKSSDESTIAVIQNEPLP